MTHIFAETLKNIPKIKKVKVKINQHKKTSWVAFDVHDHDTLHRMNF